MHRHLWKYFRATHAIEQFNVQDNICTNEGEKNSKPEELLHEKKGYGYETITRKSLGTIFGIYIRDEK